MAAAATGFRGTELKLPAELSRLPDARSWADTAAEAFGFDEMVRYQIKMAVSEGVANAVEQARRRAGRSDASGEPSRYGSSSA